MRGSRTPYTRSTPTFRKTYMEATTSTIPWASGKSRDRIAVTASRPNPGREKTDSTITAPATSPANCSAATARPGLNPFPSAGRDTTSRSETPFGPARGAAGRRRCHAGCDTGTDREDLRSEREHHRRRQALGDLFLDGTAAADGTTQVPAHSPAQEFEVLDEDGSIEPQLRAEPRDVGRG